MVVVSPDKKYRFFTYSRSLFAEDGSFRLSICQRYGICDHSLLTCDKCIHST